MDRTNHAVQCPVKIQTGKAKLMELNGFTPELGPIPALNVFRAKVAKGPIQIAIVTVVHLIVQPAQPFLPRLSAVPLLFFLKAHPFDGDSGGHCSWGGGGRAALPPYSTITLATGRITHGP